MHEIRFTMTPELLRSTEWQYLRYTLSRRRSDVIWVFLAALLPFFLHWNGASPGWILTGATPVLLLLVLVVLAGAAYWKTWRELRGVLAQLPSAECRLEFGQDGVRTTSALGTAEQPWTTIRALLRGHDAWWLVGLGGTRSFVPLAALSPETQAFVLAEAERHGIPVR
jgi:hypothetical protein